VLSPPNGTGSDSSPESSRRPGLGVVIPTLDEEENLPALLSDLSKLDWPHRVVVVDGGSTDRTRAIAKEAGANLLDSSPGRGGQMNEGARVLHTPWLLFLHADSRFPAAARNALEAWLPNAPETHAAFFRFQLDGSHWFWLFIEFGQRIRERVSGLVYGDQGLVVSRNLFTTVGGFPDLPILEDVGLVRELRSRGRLVRLPAPIITSPRRYQESGRWRGWLRNMAIITLFLAGADPRKLARFHPPRRAETKAPPEPPGQIPAGPASSALLVFAKAPTPGRVKTRLAAEVGDAEAARIYALMGKQVVRQVKDVASTTTVCFDPPEARGQVQAWLGTAGLEFRPQCAGDLGARMEEAFSDAFRRHSRVLAVGTDTPELTPEGVKEAVQRLGSSDLVLGPARDGGYYLIGLRAPAPRLFQHIPWSTSQVLDRTLELARQLNLGVSLLPTLSDVDTLSDWARVEPRLSRR